MKTLGKIILSAASIAALAGCGSTKTPAESSIIEPVVSSEEPVVSSEEPVVSSEEPVISTIESSVVSSEEPVSSIEPVVSSEEPISSAEPVHDGLAAATAFTVAEATAFGKSVLTESGTFTDQAYYIAGYIMNDSKFKSYTGTFGSYTKDYNFKLVDTADATSDYMSVSYALCAEDLAIGDYVTVYGYMELYNSYVSIYPLSKTYSETAGWPLVTK